MKYNKVSLFIMSLCFVSLYKVPLCAGSIKAITYKVLAQNSIRVDQIANEIKKLEKMSCEDFKNCVPFSDVFNLKGETEKALTIFLMTAIPEKFMEKIIKRQKYIDPSHHDGLLLAFKKIKTSVEQWKKGYKITGDKNNDEIIDALLEHRKIFYNKYQECLYKSRNTSPLKEVVRDWSLKKNENSENTKP
jgi:hypothetical protein